jgi:hypothetical protein
METKTPDLALAILPNGHLQLQGNSEGYNAAKAYFKFQQPYKAAPGERCEIKLDCGPSMTRDMLSKVAKHIAEKSGVLVAVGTIVSAA